MTVPSITTPAEICIARSDHGGQRTSHASGRCFRERGRRLIGGSHDSEVAESFLTVLEDRLTGEIS